MKNNSAYQTDGLDEGEAQNGVGEELATERWVAGDGGEESSEHKPDADSCATKTDSGGTHTHVLGDLNEGVGHLRGIGAGSDRGDRAGGVDEGGGALHGVEGGGLAGSN